MNRRNESLWHARAWAKSAGRATRATRAKCAGRATWATWVAAVAAAATLAGCPPDAFDTGEGEGEGEGDAGCGDDPILGSLGVADGFILVGGQGLPDNIVSVGLKDLGDGSPVELIGLTDDLHVVDLGVYPGSTPALPPEVFDALAPDDQGLARTGDVFPSFLVVDRALIGAGYTRATDFGGFVGAFNALTGATSYIEAPANFAAVTRDDTLFIEAAGLGPAAGGLGVYTAAAGAASFFGGLGDGAVASGNLAVTSDGVLVVGRFAGADNELFALPSATVDAVLAGGAAPDLDAAAPLYTGALNGFSAGVVGVGAGVALVDVDLTTFAGVGVSFIGLADGATVTAAAPVPVLTGGSAACTSVLSLAQTGGDLIVGVHDAAGARLVQVRKR